MDPLPPINKVFSHVIQYERQFIAMNAGSDIDESKVSINASDARRPQGRGRGSGGSTYPNSKKRQCTYCGKDNHTVDNCYKKHGFPPNFGRNAHANQVNSDDQGELDETKSYRGTESFGFTKDQYEKLVHLLQTSSTPSSSTAQVNVVQNHHTGIAYSLSNSTYGSWIIDSGASDHICSSLSYFDKYQAIAPVQVKMANGTISYAKYSGTVKLFEDLVVHNVLLCLSFH
jgi:hypothetical protein